MKFSTFYYDALKTKNKTKKSKKKSKNPNIRLPGPTIDLQPGESGEAPAYLPKG